MLSSRLTLPRTKSCTPPPTSTQANPNAPPPLPQRLSFTGQVKLHAILLRTSQAASAPRTLRVFQNREDLDFAAAEDEAPAQEFELAQTSGVQELPVRRARFGSVQRLALFFPDNFGSSGGGGEGEDEDEDEDGEVSRLSYVGFRGEWMQLGRAPANIIYEAAANPGDHKVKGTDVNQVGSGIGGRGPGQ